MTYAYKTWIENLLIHDNYHKVRTTFMIAILGIIAFNQVLLNLDSVGEYPAKAPWILGSIFWVLYILFVFVIVHILSPLLLISKRYIQYSFTLVVFIFLLLLVRNLIEMKLYNWMDIPHYRHNGFNIIAIMDILAGFCFWFISMIGLSSITMIRLRMILEPIASMARYDFIQSNIYRIKRALQPEILLKTLHLSSVLARQEAGKSTDLLVRLKELLEFNLTEGQQKKVRLTNEITHINNHLFLENQAADYLDYSITTKGNLNEVFLPGNLCLPVIKIMKNLFVGDEKKNKLDILFDRKDNLLKFSCQYPASAIADGLQNNESYQKEKRGTFELYKKMYPEIHTVELSNPDGAVNITMEIRI